MEVTKKNFKELFPEVEEAIKSALFVTIDGEFTGLNNGIKVNPYDTPSQYYDKIRVGAMDFLLIQFGLCAFKYDKTTEEFTHQAYNFYIFPKQCHSSAPDTRFLCQSSCLEFLINNGFDFNKLYRDGIPYLTKKNLDEQRARLKIIQQQRAPDNSPAGKIFIPPGLAPLVHSTCEAIGKFLRDEDSEENEMVFPKLSGFVRKLIHQEINTRFPNAKLLLDTRTMPDNTHVLVAKKGKVREEFEAERCAREEEELADAEGFTKIISLLTKYAPALVGHNMFLDLCHLLNRFCFDLPADFLEFKSALTCLFPKLFDTKFICSQPPLRDLITNSALGPLLDIVQKHPFQPVSCEPGMSGRGYSKTNEKCHEAGYDAYITGKNRNKYFYTMGLVFLSLLQYLRSTVTPPLPVHEALSSHLLKPSLNKVFLMRMAEFPYVNMEGPEPKPDRSHVFVVHFPSAWKTNDIFNLFSKYGPVNITWISDSSAFVALHRKDEKANVVKDLVQGGKKNYRVLTFAEHNKPARSSSTSISTSQPERKRRLSSNADSVAVRKKAPTSPPLASNAYGKSSLKKKKIDDHSSSHSTIEKEFTENADWD